MDESIRVRIKLLEFLFSQVRITFQTQIDGLVQEWCNN